ncbi:hypothetical protein [Andreprevotia chitinilytica]|uniref:hypothetical protein n=1 Tax=Andreprevotia chitinilytica TaxID=396808 RepID=UPI00054E5364|nr:hypothetical protein [Andreprevotia chitinilytica]
MNRLILPLLLAALVAGCDKPATPQVAAPGTSSTADTGYREPNPLLNLPPEQFKTVLGDCAYKVFVATQHPDDATRKQCYSDIRTRLKAAVNQEITDHEFENPYIPQRVKHEQDEHRM